MNNQIIEDHRRIAILGTAPNDVVFKAVESLEDSHGEIFLVVKQDRMGAFIKAFPSANGFQGEISWRNLGLLLTLRRIRADRIIIVVGDQFSHRNVFKTLSIWMQGHLLKKAETCVSYSFDPCSIECWEHRPELSPIAVYLSLGAIAVGFGYAGLGLYGVLLALGSIGVFEAALRPAQFRRHARPNNKKPPGEAAIDGNRYLPVTAFDRSLGWKNRPVDCKVDITGRGVEINHKWRCVTDRRGARATSENRGRFDGFPVIAIMGAERTFEYDMSDDQTVAWLLQERLASNNVKNYGVAGYSTCQMSLLLERIYDNERAPLVVIFELSPEHGERNLNSLKWSSRLPEIKTPYCIYSNGSLHSYPPRGYSRLPGSGGSIIIKLAEELLNRVKFRGADGPALGKITTEQILIQVKTFCENKGARLIVVHCPEDSSYFEFLRQHRFSWVIGLNDFPEHVSGASAQARKAFAAKLADAVAKVSHGQNVMPGTEELKPFESMYQAPLEKN